MENTNFNYENIEFKNFAGGKIIRRVTIKNGKGYKSVTKYHGKKKIGTKKKKICKKHISLIKKGIFIPGLFSDCNQSKTKKRHHSKKIEK
jgi:hypothetical protein